MIAIALAWLALGAPIARADLVDVTAAPEVTDPEADVDPDVVAESEQATGYCFSYERDGRRTPAPIPPAFFGSLGTHARTWEARTSLAVREQGELATLRWSFAGSFDPAHDPARHDPRVAPPLTIVVRLEGLGFVAGGGEAHLRGVHPSFGMILRSRCDGYWLEVGARAVLPWQSSTSSPSDFRSALAAVLTAGAEDDALWLPVDATAVQAYGRVSLRTGEMPGLGLVLGIGGHLVVSVGSVSTGTWLGSQRGFVGSFGLEPYVGIRPANLRIGVRAELSLSSLWPAGEIVPYTLDGVLRWAPFHAVVAEVFVGMGALLQSEAGEPTRLRWGLALTTYVP